MEKPAARQERIERETVRLLGPRDEWDFTRSGAGREMLHRIFRGPSVSVHDIVRVRCRANGGPWEWRPSIAWGEFYDQTAREVDTVLEQGQRVAQEREWENTALWWHAESRVRRNARMAGYGS